MLVSKLNLNYSFRPMTFNPNDPQTTIKSEFDGHFMSGDNRNIDTADIKILKNAQMTLGWPFLTVAHKSIFRFFSILKLTGLVFWTISFKSLQEKHENRIKNNLNQRKKVENFNLERNLNQLTASMQSIMKPLIRLVLVGSRLTLNDLDLKYTKIATRSDLNKTRTSWFMKNSPVVK